MGSEQFSDDIELDEEELHIPWESIISIGSLIVGGFCGFLGTIVLLAITNSFCTDYEAVAQKSHEHFLEARTSHSRIIRESPVKIVQVFAKETPDGTIYICDTDSDGNINNNSFSTRLNCSRIPRVGEWWELGISKEDGTIFLSNPDWDKNKEENEAISD